MIYQQLEFLRAFASGHMVLREISWILFQNPWIFPTYHDRGFVIL